jgi:hypothetical protein
MPISLQGYNPLAPNQRIWFANPAEFNSFIGSLRVPDATATTYGVVKRAGAVSYIVTELTEESFNFVTVNVDDSVPDETSFVALFNAFKALEAAFIELRTKLAAANITT